MKTACIVLMSLLFIGCGNPESNANNDNSGNSKTDVPKLEPKTIGDVKLTPQNALPNVKILIPDDFTKMNEAMLVTKYPTANRPALVYTNKNGTVNIAFNHTSARIGPNQLTELHRQLDSSIRMAQPNAQWNFSGFQNFGGRKWVQLEFVSEAVDTKIHNIMISTSASNRMLAISFNCTDKLSKKWLGIGREIVKSAVVSE